MVALSSLWALCVSPNPTAFMTLGDALFLWALSGLVIAAIFLFRREGATGLKFAIGGLWLVIAWLVVVPFYGSYLAVSLSALPEALAFFMLRERRSSDRKVPPVRIG